MKNKILALCAVVLTIAVDASAQRMELLSGGEGYHTKWVVESQTEDAVTMIGDTMEVVAARGVTLWYDKRFEGDYQISYSAKFVMEGGPHDRLSDLNCFWGAIDPAYPDDFFRQSWVYRDGDFSTYSPLDLFYVGYGGNRNSTTRFRRYTGAYVSSDAQKNREMFNEYRNPEDILREGEWMNIVITVRGGRTTYSMNGKELVNHPVAEGQDEGYFGIRLVRNHVIFTNFAVKEFTECDRYKYRDVIIEQEALATIDQKWGSRFIAAHYPIQHLENVVEVAPTESIQRAIDEMSRRGGGVVKLKEGLYPITSTITLKSGVTIIGEGAEKTILEERRGIKNACIIAETKSRVEDVVIKDLWLKGQDLESVQGLFITGVNEGRHQRIMLQDLKITGWGSQGVHIKRADHIIMDRCEFTHNGARNGLYHNLYFLYNKNITQSDCIFSNPVKGKGCKYTSCEFVLAQRCTIDNCIGNGIQADNEQAGYLFLHKYRVSNCGQVALWFPCEYYYGKFDYTEDPKYAPQNVILSRCEIVDNMWGAMWRAVNGSYVLNSHFSNKKIDMGLLKCDVQMSESTFERGNQLYDDVKQWPKDVELLW
ncbi:MAG: DUF6250 domain-containing protein [Rikenellaceae bacterium]